MTSSHNPDVRPQGQARPRLEPGQIITGREPVSHPQRVDPGALAHRRHFAHAGRRVPGIQDHAQPGEPLRWGPRWPEGGHALDCSRESGSHGHALMLTALLEFVHRLRDMAIPVSMVETLDAVNTLTRVDLSNRAQLRAARYLLGHAPPQGPVCSPRLTPHPLAAPALAGPPRSALHSGHAGDAPAGVTRARSGVQEACFTPCFTPIYVPPIMLEVVLRWLANLERGSSVRRRRWLRASPAVAFRASA